MRRCVLIFAAVSALAGMCQAYPKPTVLGGVNDWTLDVQYTKPRQIEVLIPGDKSPTRYWYIILTLTNETGRDVPFYPAGYLVTDTFQVMQAGIKINKIVFERIKTLFEGRYPFLQSVEFANSTILQGKDNTIDVAVIWPDFDPRAKQVTFFIEGLSNQTTVINPPATTQTASEEIILSKTLAMQYRVGGDPRLRDSVKLTFEEKYWAFR